MKNYNTTQLCVDKIFERHVYHRDYFAHYLRWSHVLKIAEPQFKILDFGCGSANLFEVFYRNRFTPQKYLGLDIRKQTIDNNKEKYKNLEYVNFEQIDLLNNYNFGNDWDLIVCFEVIEHLGKNNIHILLQNIKKHANNKTIILLSTPCYNEQVGAAKNHIINNEICEFTYNELKNILSQYFTITKNYGTFASIKDYKYKLNEYSKIFEKLSEYYDTNILSVMFAPLFPENSRNCLWKLSINKTLEDYNEQSTN